MSNNAAIAPVQADQGVGSSSYSASSASEILSPEALRQDATVVTNPADLRLVIEDDKDAGTVVYKTVDWRTGEVVQQLPREQVLLLRENQGYSAGSLLATKA